MSLRLTLLALSHFLAPPGPTRRARRARRRVAAALKAWTTALPHWTSGVGAEAAGIEGIHVVRRKLLGEAAPEYKRGGSYSLDLVHFGSRALRRPSKLRRFPPKKRTIPCPADRTDPDTARLSTRP